MQNQTHGIEEVKAHKQKRIVKATMDDLEEEKKAPP